MTAVGPRYLTAIFAKITRREEIVRSGYDAIVGPPAIGIAPASRGAWHTKHLAREFFSSTSSYRADLEDHQ
jgi:hypothetical protein